MLEVYDGSEERELTYETYRIDAENPYVSGYVPETGWVSSDGNHAGEGLRQVEVEVANGEPDSPDEIQRLANNPTYFDDDKHWTDGVEHQDSGIRDIIVTGTVRFAFNFYSFSMWVLCARLCQTVEFCGRVPTLSISLFFPGPILSGSHG